MADLHLGVTVDSGNKKSNEHLISLRDYDFVGEDQKLSALLAERMAVLQAPLNQSEAASGPAPEPAVPWVNVSIDYAELINASLLASAPGAGGAPAPGYGRAPAPGTGKVWSPSHAAQLGRTDGRRGAGRYIKDSFWVPRKDPSFLNYNKKVLELMKQSIYSTQRRMVELDPFIQKYERDPRFRMAFIYKRLQEWLLDMRTGMYYLLNWHIWRVRVKRVIWYYEHLLRLNIDITYSIEHLLYLHTEYTKNLDLIVPPKQRAMLQEMQKQQRKLQKMQELGLTTNRYFKGFPGG